jgi:hypothetical protein
VNDLDFHSVLIRLLSRNRRTKFSRLNHRQSH